MTVLEYLTTLRRHLVAILVLGVVGAGAGWGLAQTMPTLYQAESSVMVISTKGTTTGELLQGSTYVQNLVQTYTVVASSPLVLDKVISSLNLNTDATQLAKQVEIDTPLNTVIIQIRVTDTDPRAAEDIANSIAKELSSTMAELSPEAEDGTPAVRIETISPAVLPLFPSSPNTRLITAIGLLAGLAVGVLYAVIRRLFGTRLSSTADLHKLTESPILGEVASIDGSTPVAAVIRRDPNSRVAESMRNVVAALRYVDVEHTRRILMITSASASEGKTSVALGMALTLAEVGNRVLYVEADLRRPKASMYTQLDPSVGLTSVLVNDYSLEDAVQTWGQPNLRLLLSGDLPPNPSQLLSGSRLPALLAQAGATYDYVIVDSAPILPVADSLWVAPSVDAVILTTRLNQTTHEALRRALASVETSQTPLLGIIVNDVKLSTKSGYYATSKERRNRRAAAVDSGAPGPFPATETDNNLGHDTTPELVTDDTATSAESDGDASDDTTSTPAVDVETESATEVEEDENLSDEAPSAPRPRTSSRA